LLLILRRKVFYWRSRHGLTIDNDVSNIMRSWRWQGASRREFEIFLTATLRQEKGVAFWLNDIRFTKWTTLNGHDSSTARAVSRDNWFAATSRSDGAVPY
jgi:hypothetical protein